MKKIIALVLCVMMTMSLATTAFASGYAGGGGRSIGTAGGATVTINGEALPAGSVSIKSNIFNNIKSITYNDLSRIADQNKTLYFSTVSVVGNVYTMIKLTPAQAKDFVSKNQNKELVTDTKFNAGFSALSNSNPGVTYVTAQFAKYGFNYEMCLNLNKFKGSFDKLTVGVYDSSKNAVTAITLEKNAADFRAKIAKDPKLTYAYVDANGFVHIWANGGNFACSVSK